MNPIHLSLDGNTLVNLSSAAQVTCRTEPSQSQRQMQSLWKILQAQSYPSLRTVNTAPTLSTEAHRVDYKQAKSEPSPPDASAIELCPTTNAQALCMKC